MLHVYKRGPVGTFLQHQRPESPDHFALSYSRHYLFVVQPLPRPACDVRRLSHVDQLLGGFHDLELDDNIGGVHKLRLRQSRYQVEAVRHGHAHPLLQTQLRPDPIVLQSGVVQGLQDICVGEPQDTEIFPDVGDVATQLDVVTVLREDDGVPVQGQHKDGRPGQ